jgi:hypothetical protein
MNTEKLFAVWMHTAKRTRGGNLCNLGGAGDHLVRPNGLCRAPSMVAHGKEGVVCRVPSSVAHGKEGEGVGRGRFFAVMCLMVWHTTKAESTAKTLAFAVFRDG